MRYASLFCVLISFASLSAQPSDAAFYRVHDLGDLPGGLDQSAGKDINELGHVVGSSFTAAGRRAFYWSPPTGMIDIGVLPGATEDSEAFDLNDLGDVVGFGYGNSAFTAFRWSRSEGIRAIGLYKAFGINNDGLVVGEMNDRPAQWTASGGASILGSLPNRGRFAEAYDVNSLGHVCGFDTGPITSRGFLWSAERGMLELGDLPGGADTSVAWAINDHDQTVGIASHAIRGDGKWLYHAVLWDSDGAITDLGTLPGEMDYSDARDINNHGQVVGYYAIKKETFEDRHRGFVWTEEDGMLDLNQLLDAGSKEWTITEALGINDTGQIVAEGYRPGGPLHAVVLTPVPEPTAFRLALLAAFLLVPRNPCRTGSRPW